MDVTSALSTVAELPAPIRDVVFQGMVLGVNRDAAERVSAGLGEATAALAVIAGRSKALSSRLAAAWQGESGQAVSQGYARAGENATGQQSITRSLGEQNNSFIDITDYTNLNAIVMGFVLLATAGWQLATMEVGEAAEAAAARAALEKALAECEARVAAAGAEQEGLRALAARALEPLWGLLRSAGKAFLPEINPGMGGWAIARGVTGKVLLAGQGGLVSLGVQLYLDGGQFAKVDWGLVADATEGSVLGFVGGDLLARGWGEAVDGLLGRGEQGVVAGLRRSAVRVKTLFGVDLSGQDVEERWLARRLSSDARRRAGSWLDAGVAGLSGAAAAGRRVIVPLAVGGLGGVGGGLAAGVGQAAWGLLAQHQKLSWTMALQVLDSGISGLGAGAAGAVFHAAHGFWHAGTDGRPVDVGAALREWTEAGHTGELPMWVLLPDADGVLRPHELTLVARGADENGEPVIGFSNRGLPPSAFVDHLRQVEDRDGHQAAVRLVQRAQGIDPARLHSYFERYFGASPSAVPLASEVPVGVRVQERLTDAVLFALFPPVHLGDIAQVRAAVADSYAPPGVAAARPGSAAEQRYVEQFHRVFEPVRESASAPRPDPLTPDGARAVVDALAAVAATPGREAVEGLVETALRAVAAPHEAAWLPTYAQAVASVLTPDAVVRDAAGARAVAKRLLDVGDERDALAAFRLNRDVVNQAITHLRAEASAPAGAAAPPDNPPRAAAPDEAPVVAPSVIVDGAPLIAGDNARRSVADCLDRVERALALWNLHDPAPIAEGVPRDVALMRRLERFRAAEPGILPDGLGPDWVLDRLSRDGDTAVLLVRRKGTPVWHAYAVSRTGGDIIVADSGRQFDYLLDPSGAEPHRGLPLPDGVTNAAELETAVAMFSYHPDGLHPNPRASWADTLELREPDPADLVLGTGWGDDDPYPVGRWPFPPAPDPALTHGETLAAHLAAGRKVVVQLEIPMADVLHGYPGQYEVTVDLLEQAGGLNGLQHDLRGAAEAVRQLRSVGGKKLDVDVAVEVVIDPRRPGGGDYRPDQVERFRRSVAGLIEESASARRRGPGGRLGLRDALSEAGGGTRRGGSAGSGGSGSADKHGPVGLRGALREAAGGGKAGKGSGGSSGSGGRHAPVGLRNAMREATGKGGQPSVRPGGGHSPAPDPGALTGDAPRPDAYRVGDMVDAFADHRIPGVGEFRWEFDDDGRQTRFVLEPDAASRLTEPVELWTGDRTSGNPTWQGNVLGNLRAGLLDGVVYRVVSLHPSGSEPTLMATLRRAVEPIAAGDQWLLQPVRTPAARASGDRGFADAVSDQLGFPHQDRRPDRWAGSSTRLGAGRPRLAADDAQELTPRRPRPAPQRLAAGEYLAPEGRRQLPIVARPTTPDPPLIRPAPEPAVPASRASAPSAPRPLPDYGTVGDAEDAARSLAARRDSLWAGLVTDNPRLVSASDAPTDSHARDEWLRLLERLRERGVDATALRELDHVIRAHSDALAQLAALDPRRAAALAVDDLRHDIRGVVGGRLSSAGEFTPDELDAAMAGLASQPEILHDLRQLAPHFRDAVERLRALDAAEVAVLPVPGMVDAAGTQQALSDIEGVARVGAPPLAVTPTAGGEVVDVAEFQRAAGGRLEPVPGGLPDVVRHIQAAVADSLHANAAGAALIVVEGRSGTTPGQAIAIRPATPGDDPIRPQPSSPDSAPTGLYLVHNGLVHEIRDVNGEFGVVLSDGRLYRLGQWPGQTADGTWFDIARASAVYYSGDVAHRLPAEHQPESAVATPQAIVGSDSWAGDHEHFVEDLGPMAAVTEISAGHHRTAELPHGRNEDGLAYAVVYRDGNPVYLAVVCDGVSRSTNPHEAAHTGAWTALEHLMHAVPLSDDYETAAAEAIQAAQNDVVAIPTRSGYQDEDGPPAAAIRLMILDPSKADGDNLVTAGLGDVREYWLSAQPEGSRLLSRDHSIVPSLVDHGMSEAEALRSPWAHNIEHSLGGTNPALPTDRGTYVTSCRVEGSGVLLLCSDGMWGKTHSAEELARAVQGHDTPVQKVVALRDLALGKGERDNITGLVIEIPPTTPLADLQSAVEAPDTAVPRNDGSAQSAGAVAGEAGAGEPAERGCADVSLTDFHGLAPGVVSELPAGATRRGVEVNAVDVFRAAGGLSVSEPGDLPGAVEHVLQNGDPGGGAALVLVAYSQTAGHMLQVRPALEGDNPVQVGESDRRRFRETGLYVVDGNVENGRPREIVRDTRTGSLCVAGVDESPSALAHLARPPHGCAAIYYAGAPGGMTPEHPLTGGETFGDVADLWYSGAPSADAAGSARPTYRTGVEAGAALGRLRQRRDELAGALGVARPLNSRDAAGWRRGLDAVRAGFAQRPDEVAGRVGVTPEQMARQLDALGDVLGGHQDAVAQLERLDPRNAAAAALADAWRDVARVVEGTGMLGPGDISLAGLPAVLEEWRNVPAASGGYLDNLRRLAPDYLLAAGRVRSVNEQDAAQSATTAGPPVDAGRVPVAEIYAERDRAEAEHAAALRARHVFQDGPLQVTDAELDTDPTGVVERLRRTRSDHQEQVRALADAVQRTAEARARLDGIDQQIAARQWRLGATRGSADDVAGMTCVNGHLIGASQNRCPTCPEHLADWQGDRDIALVSHRGTHARNEDAVRAAKVGNVRVAAIGDGVSDSSDGQLAARAATTSLVDQVSADLGAGLDPAPALRNGLIAAQDGAVAVGAGYEPPVLPNGEPDPNWLGPPMSTIVGATVTDLGNGQAVVDMVWIGDSRGYWIPAAGPHEQLTVDDSEEIEVKPGKRGKVLSYWLGSSGSGDDRRVYGAVADAAADDSHTRQVTVSGPGWVVLATDGVFSKMSPTAMAEKLGRHGGSLLDAAGAVVEASTSSDDKSLVVVPVGIDSSDVQAATPSADPAATVPPRPGPGWLQDLES